MDYLSVNQIAEKWGISPELVRRHCRQKRIPKAKQVNGSWMIPANAKKPENPGNAPKGPLLPPLAVKLMRQKKKKNYHGLYDYVQIDFTYSSSRMASNRLTRGQVETIFRKGKVRESFEPLKVSDLVEVMNHCVCVDYVLDHISEPLSQKFIQELHYKLMFGTVDHRKAQVAPGEYRTAAKMARRKYITDPGKIDATLGKIIKGYENLDEIGMTEILEFHVMFEQMVPFGDGNGRVGRLIMFKECLRHGVMPFILDDKHRNQYIKGIQEWREDRTKFMQVAFAAQERFEHQLELHKLAEYRSRAYMNQHDHDENIDDKPYVDEEDEEGHNTMPQNLKNEEEEIDEDFLRAFGLAR